MNKQDFLKTFPSYTTDKEKVLLASCFDECKADSNENESDSTFIRRVLARHAIRTIEQMTINHNEIDDNTLLTPQGPIQIDDTYRGEPFPLDE